MIIPAWSIDAAHSFCDYKTTENRELNQCVRISLRNIASNRIPSFNNRVAEPADTPIQISGFHRTEHVGRLNRAPNTACFTHGSLNQAETTTRFQDPFIHAWNSYRNINSNLSPDATRAEKINFILDFRPLYGTNVTLAKSRHPFLIIPSA